VTTGPYIEDQEVRKVDESLRIKALELKIERSIHVSNAGFKLLKNLASNEKKPYGYLGILVTSIDKYVARIYQRTKNENKVIIYGLVEDSPAKSAGLEVGDVILRMNGKRVTPDNFGSLIKKAKPESSFWIKVDRNDQIKEFILRPKKVYYPVSFLVVDSQDVNAGAFPGGVAVTYGLLNFVKNDDELAIVLGHELAHLVRGHILKSQGFDLLTVILAAVMQTTVDVPQSGDLGQVLGSAFSARFSREFEREADFLGTLLAHKSGFDIEQGVGIWERFAIELPKSLDTGFLTTHPTSSERLVRIKKITEQIKNQTIKVEDYLN